MKKLFELFLTFFKIGLISFGGGYAIIPIFQRECVQNKKWITDEELTDVMGISQALPGAIMVNASTMIGYKISHLKGALIAAVASNIPTFFIMLLVTVFFWEYTNIEVLQKVFKGILLGVTSMIIFSLVNIYKSVVKSYFDILLVIFSAALLIVFKINAVFVILGLGILGFVWNLHMFKRELGKESK
ncbi:MAG: chromate transporter [Clostridia bacterium]|nr:chromate transporter [Clostridia bacterium]